MDKKYDKCRLQWNEVFSRSETPAPTAPTFGNKILDDGLTWLCNGTDTILDFGCGNGTMLLLCALNGTTNHIGIDLSESAIESAKKRSTEMTVGKFLFSQGGIEYLQNIDSTSIDAVILSNIVDNLYPEDAEILMNNVNRILNKNGKILVKLNPYITEEQIKDWNIKVIKDNLLDDGLILWNNTTVQWENFFKKDFIINQYEDIYYPDHDQYNRMFLLCKKNSGIR